MQAPASASVEQEGCDDEGSGEDDILQSCEGREAGERDEPQLVAPARRLQRDHAEVEGGEDERVGERIGEDERGEDEVGERERERGARERVAGPETETPGEQVDGYGSQGHEERVLELHEAVRGGGRADQPEWSGEERLEQGGEVG